MPSLRDSVDVSEPSPLHERIRKNLVSRIGRDWVVGDRMPSIHELCRQLGTGRSNTWRAVRELVQQGVLASEPGLGTVVRRLPTAGEISGDGGDAWEPQLAARMRGRATPARKKIYLPLDQNRDLMVHRMAGALVEKLQAHGYSVERGPNALDFHLDFTTLDADAVLLVQSDVVQTLRYRDDQIITMVNTSGETPTAMSRGYDLVTIDQIHGGVLAGEHLRGLGVTSACYIQCSGVRPGQSARLDALRLAGFEQGFGRSIPPELRLMCDTYSVDRAASLLPRFLRLTPRPKAVFTSCDEFAVGFLSGALAHGLVPKLDYELVGFDGQARGQGLALGPLTTVAVPAEAMGAQAADFLLSRLQNPDLPPRRIALGCSMILGNTTSPEPIR